MTANSPCTSARSSASKRLRLRTGVARPAICEASSSWTCAADRARRGREPEACAVAATQRHRSGGPRSSESLFLNLVSFGEAAAGDADHAPTDHGLVVLGEAFVVADTAAVSGDPG